MKFKKQFRKWKFPHPKDHLKLDKPYNEVIDKTEKLSKETDDLIKKIEKSRPSKESIRIFLENM